MALPRTSRNFQTPAKDSTKPFWHSERHYLHDYRSTDILSVNDIIDVVIIGAGYAGVATAYNLVKNDIASDHSKLSVMILDARSVCSGATRRNGGHLRPDLYGHIPKYINRAGVRAGAEIAEFEIAHVQALKELIFREKIDCDSTLTRTCDVWNNQDAADEAKVVYDRLRLDPELSHMEDIQFIIGKDAETVSGVKGAKACSTYNAATLSPYKLITSLLASTLATGSVNLQANTPVISIQQSAHGCHLVETPRGISRARKVVYANNAYVSCLLPEYFKNIIPCKGICCHVTIPKGITAYPMDWSYIVRTEDGILDYLIPRPDGSIIENSDAKIESIWTSRFNGHGMPVIWLAAKGLAEMLEAS
ncbi:hypothetical protein BPAE_0314g00080 [Botrytis paeoniae]|uniref:FAD dependent oxidoreductase domain-containing protein n=1 Tax=Botrytis paeoniae TaxID=278948 RepID=A0A4Z1F7M6_9HELO|nr:hypothetical protein BPAE_0314g00080 [Botrytis paeoniae]